MNEIMQANIFFIIASVGVVLFTIITSFILYQVYKIVRTVRRIVDRIEAGSEVLVDEIEDLRARFNPSNMLAFIMNIIPGMSGGGTRRQRSREE